jgi:SPP1 gp7 family putative phage head morphogenesis protein
MDTLEEHIKEILRLEVYVPLLLEIDAPKEILSNSTSSDALLDAIASGKITFYRGKFRGKLNAGLSRELLRLGASWDEKQGCFSIPLNKLSRPFREAIAASHETIKRTQERINKVIDKISPAEIADKLQIQKIFDTTLWKVDNQFKHTIKALSVTPQISPKTRQAISKEYTLNMKLDIKGWLEEEVVQLRRRMEKSTWQGNRYESMVSTIKRRYGVADSKAKILARQETNLLVTKLKECRYLEAGVPDYRWRCVKASPNHPVRPYHLKNDGKIFSWKNPPVVNARGERKHPGCDYNCRCIAIPVVRF